MSEQLGYSVRSVQYMSQIGLSEWQADRCACRAGFHPMAIWAEWGAHGDSDADALGGLHEDAVSVKGSDCCVTDLG